MGWYCLLEALGRIMTNPTNLNSLILLTPQCWFIGIVSASGRTCYWPHWRLLGLGYVGRVDLRKEPGGNSECLLCGCNLCTKWEAQCCCVPGYEHAHRYPMWSDQRRFTCDGLSWMEKLQSEKKETHPHIWQVKQHEQHERERERECTELPGRWKKKLSRPLVCTFFFCGWFDLRLRFAETSVHWTWSDYADHLGSMPWKPPCIEFWRKLERTLASLGSWLTQGKFSKHSLGVTHYHHCCESERNRPDGKYHFDSFWGLWFGWLEVRCWLGWIFGFGYWYYPGSAFWHRLHQGFRWW